MRAYRRPMATQTRTQQPQSAWEELLADYKRERAERRTRGEQSPAHASLREHYGSWVSTVAAAMALVWEGSAARVPASRKTPREQRSSFTRAEVIAALKEVRDVLGDWPGEQVFFDYIVVERALRRLHGDIADRLPSGSLVRRLFGDFESAGPRPVRGERVSRRRLSHELLAGAGGQHDVTGAGNV
jgi:hypothetical protein